MDQRGVVLEITEEEAIVLTDNGEFKRIPLPQPVPAIGDEIVISPDKRRQQKQGKSKKRQAWYWMGLAVAALFLFALNMSGLKSIFYEKTEQQDVALLEEQDPSLEEPILSKPVRYVSVDINPSIELGLNEQDQVITMRSLNDEGEKIIAQRALEGLPVEKAIQEIAAEALLQGYLASNKANTLLITVYTEGEENEKEAQKVLEDKLRQSAQQILAQDNLPTHKVQTIQVSKEQRERAEELGLSVGKFAQLLDAMEQGVPEEKDEKPPTENRSSLGTEPMERKGTQEIDRKENQDQENQNKQKQKQEKTASDPIERDVMDNNKIDPEEINQERMDQEHDVIDNDAMDHDTIEVSPTNTRIEKDRKAEVQSSS
ncbi:anti-sigma factor domain-containing protein [Heliorestis convoluta]|uniref:Anti-sigma factor domain-containing protein n=1 Tax=Heliorestis convoluta TaxID=356322 RepID=A0A5Q2MXU2_9FIRM|nr:anti-sigma factor domain-containing protein [Heliorestis convoluta]QGG46691.1 anti-sigma factor domain-containing protein [Heliorestis convoluta]